MFDMFQQAKSKKERHSYFESVNFWNVFSYLQMEF